MRLTVMIAELRTTKSLLQGSQMEDGHCVGQRRSRPNGKTYTVNC